MKKLFLSFAIVASILSSCKKDDAVIAESTMDLKSATGTSAYDAAATLPVVTVSGEITTDTEWDNDHVYEIQGVLRVTGGTLTIEAGTFIKGDPDTSDPTGVLVITKTGKINAVGTSSSPIVFTSYNLLDGNSSTNSNVAAGDFGGVILLGDAPTNSYDESTPTIIEGLDQLTNSEDFEFGGTYSSHNAGKMEYVRIEYAGSDLSGPNSGNEVNGLTLGGVGSGTTLDHIQISYGLDDGIEFFGGCADLEYVIIFAQTDDGLDFDNGYTGSVTNALVIADLNSEHSTSGSSPNEVPDSNGIELDNDASGSTNTPITRPVITNLSIIGVSDSTNAVNNYEKGMHIRRNGQIDLTNVTVTGYGYGIYWESPSVYTNSSYSNVRAHGFVAATYPTISLGLGKTSTSSTASYWGLAQPFFNGITSATSGWSSPASSWDLSGSTGAFYSESGWAADDWTKYDF